MDMECLLCEVGIKFLAMYVFEKETVGPDIAMPYTFPFLTFELVD